MNQKVRRLLVVLCTSFCALTNVFAQFSYTNNNPSTTIVPYGGTFTYSVSWSGGTGGGGVMVGNLETPQGNINFNSLYPSNYTFTYTFNNINSSFQGDYALDFEAGGIAKPVILEVSPGILVQPQNTTCISGASTTMGILAGPNTATYQWFNAVTGTPISGTSTSPAFSPVFTSLSATNGEYIYCKISNNFGTVYSSPALLTVIPSGVSFVMSNLSAVIIPYGSSFTYSVAWNVIGSGDAVASFNFSGNNFVPITGNCPTNGTFSYTVDSVDNNSPNNFRFVVNSISTPYLVAYDVSPAIIAQPQEATCIAGASTTMGILAGPLGATYQWYNNNGSAITGPSASPEFTPTALNNGQLVFCRVSNAYGVVNSDPVLLNVTAAPDISEQPANAYISAGQSAAFSVTATGTQPLFYQWYENGLPITGANLSSLILPSVTSSDTNNIYQVVVTNAYGQITSANASISIGTLPMITGEPLSMVVTQGQNAIFSVSVAGTAPFSYQWMENGTNLTDGGEIAGSLSNVLSLTGVTTNDTGAYAVIISNAFGTNTSVLANLSVGASPQGFNLAYGSNGITLRLTGTANFNYAVQATTNLSPPIIWQSIATNAADASGNWLFIDTNSVAYPARFYRATVP